MDGQESNVITVTDAVTFAGAGRYNRVSMFSSRFHWDATANRLTRALAAKRAAGARILDLTESNPTHAGLHYPQKS